MTAWVQSDGKMLGEQVTCKCVCTYGTALQPYQAVIFPDEYRASLNMIESCYPQTYNNEHLGPYQGQNRGTFEQLAMANAHQRAFNESLLNKFCISVFPFPSFPSS